MDAPYITIHLSGEGKLRAPVGRFKKYALDDYRYLDEDRIVRAHMDKGMPVVTVYDTTDTILGKQIIRLDLFKTIRGQQHEMAK